ncbi:MAG TPA: thioredoxin family protein [Bacteroidales bacterium]|nr:thioredoxin family protein [Bacteroidales bacterium]HRZ76338.1 thioredoxin family protein [Bacteroidales bacterium]
MDHLKGREQAYALLYLGGSEKSSCALDNVRNSGKEDLELLTVDVSQVRDVHTEYGVTSAPTLLVFRDGALQNVVKGCHDPSYFRAVFDRLVTTAGEGSPQKSVTVYTTPSCTWCTTLKNYLRQKGISYQEVDVSRDPREAEELVRRTGQQGVPQSNIGGEWVVGFDKTRINTLLGIQ